MHLLSNPEHLPASQVWGNQASFVHDATKITMRFIRLEYHCENLMVGYKILFAILPEVRLPVRHTPSSHFQRNVSRDHPTLQHITPRLLRLALVLTDQ
jgi:hypothetical protein